MHREKLLKQLNKYRSQWIEESDAVERLIRFVETNVDCFKRSLLSGHVTGSAWVVDSSRENVLLTHHKKLNRWLQLGGHTDGESDVMNSALREVEEESGLSYLEVLNEDIFDIDIHPIPERGLEPEHFHYDVRFAFQVCGDETYTVSDESHDLSWVPIESLEEYSREGSMLRMARKWQSNKAD
jgi:8-oxo-dGTP pyrophosphatase MutT (NUDIX family)